MLGQEIGANYENFSIALIFPITLRPELID
jgi:hypothetical protein